MDEFFEFFTDPYRDTSTREIILEVTAVFFGILSVWFARKGNILVYATGIISTAIYIYICYTIGYFGDFIINIYYTGMSIYGWYLWSNAGKDDALSIEWAEKKELFRAFGIFIFTMLFVVAVYLYFDKFVDWTNYLDVLTTGLAFGSMWLMAKKKVENWIGWIITDIISVPLYLAKGLGFTSLQFAVFLVLAIQGYIMWKRSVGKVKADE